MFEFFFERIDGFRKADRRKSKVKTKISANLTMLMSHKTTNSRPCSKGDVA